VDEEVLDGGVANAGAVVRVGDDVLRPTNRHTPTIHALLRHLRAVGFTGAPDVVGLEPDGRERLRFIPGLVPMPPYPAWSLTDEALASTARLLRRFHDATATFVPPPGATWSDELNDPSGETEVICHNDLCPENVVFDGEQAVAFLDFDFAAPGRRVFDLCAFARMSVPLDAPENAARTGRGHLDPFARFRIVADAYDLPPGRGDLVDIVDTLMTHGATFVQRHVEAGEPAFVAMWDAMGGAARYELRDRWFADNRARLHDAIG
jgi:phosphotransferase family enzyme